MINTKYKDLIPNATLDEFFEKNKDKVETRTISYYLNPKNQLDDDTRIKPMEIHEYTGIFIDFREYNEGVDNIIPYGRISGGSALIDEAFIGTLMPTPYKDVVNVVMLWIRKISDIEKIKMSNNGLNFTENFYKVGIFTNELK